MLRVGLILFGSLLLTTSQVARANSSIRLDLAPRPETCAPEFPKLIQQMLPVLPSYANRVYIRSDLPKRYMIIASPPNFEPLPLQISGQPTHATSDPPQVFFSTLIRRYQGQQIENLQEYHWLFLTRSETGWRFSMLYTSLGSYPQNNPPSPPRNNSEGAIATAIRAWLRDCRTIR